MTANEWLEWRRGGLSSSDIAAALGQNPRRSPGAVQREKLGDQDEPAFKVNEDSFWGDVMEPHVAQAYCDRTGSTFVQPEEWADLLPAANVRRLLDEGRPRWGVELKAAPVCRATPDYLIQRKDKLWVLEIKTTGKVEAWKRGVPTNVLLQVQWQMLVMGIPRAVVVVLFFGRSRKMRSFEVELLDAFQVGGPAQQAAVKWWREYVEEGRPCRPASADIPWLTRKYPKGNGKTLALDEGLATLDQAFIETAKAYETARNAAKKAKLIHADVQAQLRALIGDASFAEIEGTGALYSLHSLDRGGRVLRRKRQKWTTSH